MTAQAEPQRPGVKTHAAVTGGGSALNRYADVIVGRRGIGALLLFEFCMLFRNTPGALGLLLRKKLWPRLFESCGRGVVFGTGISLRHPNRIRLGNNVVISDGCVLDARYEGEALVISLGDDCILADNVILQGKGAKIAIGRNVGFGPGTLVQTTTGADIAIGDDVMIGPRCTLIGAGNYHFDRLDIPMFQQGMRRQDGITVGSDVWMGCNVTILTAIEVGSGSILGAGAVVRTAVPPYAIMAGVPARQIGSRDKREAADDRTAQQGRSA